MLTAVQALVGCAALTLAMLLTGAVLRGRWWTTDGLLWSFSNREKDQEASAVAGRADRAARNMLEGMVLFLTVMLAARFEGGHVARVETGATIFFWARLVYWPVYLIGVPYLRTGVWGVSVVGIGMIGLAIL